MWRRALGYFGIEQAFRALLIERNKGRFIIAYTATRKGLESGSRGYMEYMEYMEYMSHRRASIAFH